MTSGLQVRPPSAVLLGSIPDYHPGNILKKVIFDKNRVQKSITM